MALTAGQKAQRVLSFLMGFRSQAAVAAMKPFGFKVEDVEEGWTLLRATGLVAVSQVSGDPIDNSFVLALDGWENRWFPVAKATLERRHPAVAAQLFMNLAQQEGAAATLSVSAFLTRYDEMSKGKGKYGDEGKAAAKVLAERGLTKEEIENARTLLTRVGAVDFSDAEIDEAASAAAFEKAQHEMWQWYLEWSQVARTAISSKKVLRLLGFGKSRTSPVVDDGSDDSEDDDVVMTPEPIVPEPVTPVAPGGSPFG